MNKPESLNLRTTRVEEKSGLPLPGILQGGTRSGAAVIDPLLAGVTVAKVYTLASTTRGETAGTAEQISATESQLLAVEAEDGATLFIRSDKLVEDIARLRPEAVANGEVDFSRFRDPNATARGLGDVFWKAVSVLKLPAKDELVEQARELAFKWAREKLGGAAVDAIPFGDTATVLGAKALMWVIESRLAGRPGLYQWSDAAIAASDRCLPGDARLAAIAEGKPALILIHGTASYTVASYAGLRTDEATWNALRQRFPGGIFGYEHRSFSQSPIENALELLEVLPKSGRISLMTHSRGGLVGDLLCLGQVSDEAIAGYRNDTTGASDVAGLERVAEEERGRLRAIRSKLVETGIIIERYVRVACPARGTRLLSDNLEVALSDFLNLAQKAAGGLATVLASPAAGAGASSALGVLKRLVLEIAGKRIDPRLVPGIAAMRVDSPLAAFLADPGTRRRDGIAMAVVAGDTEFEGIGVSHLGRRVVSLFCDWRLFDRGDNDLVVDTDSMFAGLGFREGAKYLYDQDESVTHFRYFLNPLTRDSLRGWLVEDDLGRLSQFQPLTGSEKVPWPEREAARVARGAVADPHRPVVILIPGIMGSHIEVREEEQARGSGDRIWFDFLGLAVGKLDRIGDPGSKQVFAEDVWERFYGDLADYLAETHNVIRCPYDWRREPTAAAGDLGRCIDEAAKNHPGQPIRLLAHSMGGLVVRTLMKVDPARWDKVIASGGRLLMLGTPNNGSHSMVHTLLGKTDSIRMLEKLDGTRSLQQILEIVRGFPGALALLPRPGFRDAGTEPRVGAAELYQAATWRDFKMKNTDRWYGDGICGVPDQPVLDLAGQFWKATLTDNEISNPERVAYIFGQGRQTPNGVRIDGDRLRLMFTAEGDGSVTWASGRLGNLPDERCWYMPVEHADLAGEAEFFPAIAELLEKGVTDRLGRLPKSRAAESRSFELEAAPPVVPSEEELARALMGGGPRRRKTFRARQTLRVSVRAGDLRFLDQPVLCGHYIGDAISGAEAVLDDMLDGRLIERKRLGLYASDIGTSVIVLGSPSEQDRLRGSRRGALIVGLGDFNGQLTRRQVTETVRAGVLRYLLLLRDAYGALPDVPVPLYSLLIGCSSTANMTIAESLVAVTAGVLEANRQVIEALGKKFDRSVLVTDLCFIELYRDAAITAARATLDLPQVLEGELKRLGARIETARTLGVGEGVLERLSASDEEGHWSRLIVTDADATEAICPPECYDLRQVSPIPPHLLRRLAPEERCKCTASASVGGAAAGPSDAAPAEMRYYPQRLKYVLLSPRARAETVVQQRQPGFIEAIIRDQRRNPGYDASLGHLLFELMVPLDYKSAAREQSRLLLVLDGYTANLPWELLLADDEPLVLGTRMVRQLATTRYRMAVRTANTDSACIIVAPGTEGYGRRFRSDAQRLPDLPAAIDEGDAVRGSLQKAGWTDITYSPEGRTALDVLATLYRRPYRVLMIAAHGVFEAEARDGRRYSGVVLSDGLLLTANEISLMEVVPEVVFLNCCHLGSINTGESNRLAASVAREAIEMGVRCVIAAGWAVDDEAAKTFAGTFFEQLTHGESFGDAVFEARKATYRRHGGSNTWGAYQAYGDPGYRLNGQGAPVREARRPYVAVEELLSALQWRRVQDKRPKSGKRPSFGELRQWVNRQLDRCPSEWSEYPAVLQAIGEAYGEYGAAGFGPAREAYQRAIQREDQSSRVSLKLVEQLANLEARQGQQLVNEKGREEEGMRLIDCAIQRLRALGEVARCDGSAALMNPERAGILGSALKRKAAALAEQGKVWNSVAKVLAEAAEAYRSGVAGDPARTPYNTLNALPLAWLAGTLDEPDSPDLALRCGEEARRGFVRSKDFWDAAMSADGELTAWLLGKPLARPVDQLFRICVEAVASIPQSDRQWDSVVTQLRLLATLLRSRAKSLRSQKDQARARADQDRAHDLEQLAGRLDPSAALAQGQGADDAEPAPEVDPEASEKPD